MEVHEVVLPVEGEHIAVPVGDLGDVLLLEDPSDRGDLVADPRRPLVLPRLGRPRHPLLQPGDEGPVPSAQEEDRLLDKLLRDRD